MASTDQPEPRVTVVVVTWNGAHLLGPCLDSLGAQTELHRLLVVDNASTDATARLLADQHAEAQVIRLHTNTGFAGGAQAGLDAVITPYVAFLNNDAVAEPEWLATLVALLDGDETIAAGTSRILLANNGAINNAGGALTRWGVGYDRGLGAENGPCFDRAADVAALCGGAAVVRREHANRVGGFPTEFFLYYEDTDLSWRLRRAGWRIRYVPGAIVHHQHSASSDQSSAPFAFYNQRNQLLMLIRNAPLRLVLATLVRFTAVTIVRVVRPVDGHAADPAHRLRVLRGVLRMLPAALRARYRDRGTYVLSRREFVRQWLGTEER